MEDRCDCTGDCFRCRQGWELDRAWREFEAGTARAVFRFLAIVAVSAAVFAALLLLGRAAGAQPRFTIAPAPGRFVVTPAPVKPARPEGAQEGGWTWTNRDGGYWFRLRYAAPGVAAGTFRAGHNASHDCPSCGRAQFVVAGPGPRPGTHRHDCASCGTSWYH